MRIRVVIIANGELKDPAYHRTLINNNDYIICVNGGSIHALALGLHPDLLIGDLDSLPPAVKAKILSSNPEVIEHPPAKDKSDLELGLESALRLKPLEIIILGALGGKRLDHAFINLLLLKLPLQNKVPAAIINEQQEVRLTDGDLLLKGRVGDHLSLFALTDPVKSVFTEGLKYPLAGEDLHFASSRGLSNEFTSPEARVKFVSGLLLAIRTVRR